MAINYPNLRCCIEAHPSWQSTSDQDLAVWCNTEQSVAPYTYRPSNVDPRVMWDVIISNDDYETLTDAERDLVKTTMFAGGNQAVDVSDNTTPAVQMFIKVFGGTPTLGALNTAFTYSRTPGQYYEVGAIVSPDHVAEARANHTCGS